MSKGYLLQNNDGSITVNLAYTFPTVDGSPGQILKTDGAGNLTFQGDNDAQNLWETISSDSGSVAANTPTDTLTVSGGDGINTSISGDTLSIVADINSTNLRFTSNQINTIQDIDLTASPTFVGLTLTGLTPGSVLFVGASDEIKEDNVGISFNDITDTLSVQEGVEAYGGRDILRYALLGA